MTALTPTETAELQAHIAELESFLKGRVFRGWSNARVSRLAQTEQTIVDFDPVDRKDEIEVFKLRGERRLLLDLEKQFEDTLVTLKNTLLQSEELLQQNKDKEK